MGRRPRRGPPTYEVVIIAVLVALVGAGLCYGILGEVDLWGPR